MLSTYALIIFLAEQRHRTFRFRRLEIHDVGFDRQITTVCVHQVFDRTNLLLVPSLPYVRVKRSTLSFTGESLLRYMSTQNLAQRSVHQVRCGSDSDEYGHDEPHQHQPAPRRPLRDRQAADVTNGRAVSSSTAKEKLAPLAVRLSPT